jgi:hypothetical protein
MYHPPHPDGRRRSAQQAPEAARLASALPKHSEDDSSEQRRDEDAEKLLHIVHDACCTHHQIRGADRDGHANDRRPAPHRDIVRIRRLLVDVGAVEMSYVHAVENALTLPTMSDMKPAIRAVIKRSVSALKCNNQ